MALKTDRVAGAPAAPIRAVVAQLAARALTPLFEAALAEARAELRADGAVEISPPLAAWFRGAAREYRQLNAHGRSQFMARLRRQFPEVSAE